MNNRQYDSLLRVTTANKLNLKVVLYSLRGVDIERLLKKKSLISTPLRQHQQISQTTKMHRGFM